MPWKMSVFGSITGVQSCIITSHISHSASFPDSLFCVRENSHHVPLTHVDESLWINNNRLVEHILIGWHQLCCKCCKRLFKTNYIQRFCIAHTFISILTFFSPSLCLALSPSHSLWSVSVAKCGRQAGYNSSSIMLRYTPVSLKYARVRAYLAYLAKVVPSALGLYVWRRVKIEQPSQPLMGWTPRVLFISSPTEKSCH